MRRLKWPDGGRLWRAGVWALIGAYFLYFGVLTVQKHDAFQTTAFDLGNVDQAVWNTRHGRLLAMTNIEGLTNRLGTHVEPILVPISLLYFVWSDPRALLLLQTAVIALGAWPVYLIAQRAVSGLPKSSRSRRTKIEGPPAHDTDPLSPLMHQALPLTFVLAYLFFPALESANLFDFHAVALAPTFFLFAFYYLLTERWGTFALFALLTMSCKEDAPLLVVALGLYLLAVSRGRQWRIALPTIAIAMTWFIVAVGVIMPHFDTGGVSPFANRYAWLGDGPVEMAVTLFTRPGLVAEHVLAPENLAYLRDWLAPVAWLPLLAPLELLLAAPVLAVNLLSTDGFMHQLEGFHYGALLAPVAVIAAAYGAAWLIRRLPNFRPLPALIAIVVLTATLVYHIGHGYTPLAGEWRLEWAVVSAHDRLGQEMAGRVPATATVAALPYLNPHVSERQGLTMIDRVENGLPAPLHDAEVVWLDVTNDWPLHPNDLKAGIENLLAGDYGLAEAADGYLLLQRGAPGKTLPDAFYDFARAGDPRPQYPMRLQFLLDGQPALECLGFDLSWQKDGVQATYYWRALRFLPPGLRLYPFYFDDATGQILEDTAQRPLVATIWYPPEDWKPGEVIKTSMLPWPVGPDFGVGLGVVQGQDWSAVDRRLPIYVESSDLVVRLFDGDTWARLIGVEDGKPVEEWRVFETPSPQNPLVADFGPIRLLGYDLDSRRKAVTITLTWQADERMDTGYTVFVQLLDAQGLARAQVDAVPQGGSYPTFWWLPGEVVADPVILELPADLLRGESYRLIAGLYDPATGDRLTVAETGLDYVELTRFQP